MAGLLLTEANIPPLPNPAGGCGLIAVEISMEDRLSALPDEIILLIFSFLPDTRLCYQLSTLARRWRHLAPHCPVIRIPLKPKVEGYESYDHIGTRYMCTVDHCLRAHCAPSIHCLQLDLPPSMCYIDRDMAASDRWIQFAGQRSVTELHLSAISLPCFIRYQTRISGSIFSLSHSLTSLFLDCCYFNQPFKDSFHGFNLLKELSISNSSIIGERLAYLLRYCLVIESLQLIHCNSLGYLELEAATVPNLRHLEIEYSDFNKALVEAPGLRSLFVKGGSLKNIVLKGCPLLADVEFYDSHLDSLKHQPEFGLLSCLSMVEHLSLDSWIFKVDFVRFHTNYNILAIFKNLKHLCCNVDSVTDDMFCVFSSVLEECPSLVELHVKLLGNNKVVKYWLEHPHQEAPRKFTADERSSFNLLNNISEGTVEQEGCGTAKFHKGTGKSSQYLRFTSIDGYLGGKTEAMLLQHLLSHVMISGKLVVIGFQCLNQMMFQNQLSKFREGFPGVQIMHRLRNA